MPPLRLQPQLAEEAPDDLPSTARVLVVDDDERNLLALSHVLRDVAEVVTASSGREALRHLLHGEFAVILLDVFMPDMDGYEVADLIRERKQTARIPIIFLSAVNKEAEHLIRGYAMGAVDYVFKPVDPVILTSKVGVFVDLFDMRKQVEAKSRAQRELREAGLRAELERLKIENELHSTMARQTAVLEALPLALFEATQDERGTLVREFVAGDLEKLAGADAVALGTGELHWEDRIHADDRAVLATADAARAVFSADYRWQCGDGTHKHFIERAVPISCDHDGSVRWAGTLLDITERKKLEAQLLQAGKMDALGQLTGGVAHDFNNILAAVLGGVRLLERKAAFNEGERRIAEQVRLAAERGVDLVRRMMAFARRQELAPDYLHPSSVCEAVSGLIEQTLGGTVQLSWNCADTDLVFFADRSQLELALVNLIINARDAMPDGGRITVTISAARSPADPEASGNVAQCLCIEVADEGTGIPAAAIERITEPFFTTKEVGKGTGLGLSMVAGFVQQSGGSIAIASEEGLGTTVVLRMPAVRPSSKIAAGDAEAERDADSLLHRVLIVDDDPSVRMIVGEQLRELGAEVATASCGSEALERIACQGPFDVLLTDYAMPSLNGLRLLQQAHAQCPTLRCALMTGYADERLEAAVPAEIRLLRKPIAPADLAALLACAAAAD